MTRELWTPEQLLADFEKEKHCCQRAILVIVKSEYCYRSEYRICAATTAALEKRSTPALAKFLIYGAWIRSNPGQRGREWLRWEDEVATEYNFDQGPGARLIVIIPGEEVRVETNARDVGLTVGELEENRGSTPKLEAFLNHALD